MNIEYRKLLPEESKIYRMIRLESLQKFPEAFCATYEETIKNEKLRIEFDIENQTPERFVVGGFYNDLLIGICTFVKDENGKGNIYQMYVKEEFQGNNIGVHLIYKTIEEARTKFENIEIYLEVKHTNLKAYRLYQKIGFADVENKADSEIMMKYFK